MNKSILLLSDLHLESSNMKLNEISQDIVVLAGDICIDQEVIIDFIYKNIPPEKPIIFVLGNHEYEGRVVNHVVHKLKTLFKDELPEHQIHILDNQSIVIDGVKFIGSTLWSNFECFGLNSKKEIMELSDKLIISGHHMSYLNPYYGTGNHPQYLKVTAKEVEIWSQKCIDFIDFELKQPFNGPKVVVTHFAPHKLSISKEYHKKDDVKYNMLSAFWVNSLDKLMGFSDYWIHGHVHHSFDYEVEGTRVLSNPRGNSQLYDMSPNVLFQKDKEIKVKIATAKLKI